MRLDEIISELSDILEAPYSGWVGAQGRPDADYVGQAYGQLRRPYTGGGKDYPYDRNRDYDANAPGRDMHSGDRTPIRAPLTAKNKGVTKKSGFEEASGTPMNFAMSGRGGSELGNPAPGMGGSWANRPEKPWDEDEEEKFADTVQAYEGEDKDKATMAGKRYAAMMRYYGEELSDQTGEENPDPMTDEDREVLGMSVPVEEPAVLNADYPEDQSDAELDTRADMDPENTAPSGDFDSFPSVLMQVMGSGFGNGLGKTNPSGRGFMTGWTEDYDVLAQEGAWQVLSRLLGLQ